MTSWSWAEAVAWDGDTADPLASYRDAFVVVEPDLIYLDGNSLGRLPQATGDLLARQVKDAWGERLVRAWNEGWYDLAARLGAKIANLIGAQPDEVVVADSTSVNLFKLAVAAGHSRPGRTTILTDDLNFPSDLYILEGAGRVTDQQLRKIPSADGVYGPAAALAAALDETTAVLSLSHTAFKSGYLYDAAMLTAVAHDAGALTLWDLSHSVGAVPLEMNAWGVDLAVGCTYKYLNGGPGAPAFLYIRRDLQAQLHNPISGWFGQADPFAFGPEYEAAPGLRRFLTGTPPILSLAAIEPGVDLLLEAGMTALRKKSLRQSDFLIALWERHLAPLGFTLRTPREPARRGSHVALAHPEGWRINQALIEGMDVLPDFRAPDNIRIGIAPLYTRFGDILTAVKRLVAVVAERRYERYPAARPAVT